MNPEALDNFRMELGSTSETLLALSLALMIFAVALGLRLEHFRFFKETPKIYFSGVFAQMIGLPLLTILVCFALSPHPSVALGMIIIACCPGGNVSNLISLFARANTALSVSLTATSSLFAAFLTPVSILFWSALYPPTRNLLKEINFSTLDFLVQTLFLLAIPLLLGMLMAAFLPKLAERLKSPLAALGGLAMIWIIVSAFAKYWDVFLALGLGLIGIVVLHNALAFGLGHLAGAFAKAERPEHKALTIEVGIQNSGLALVILITQLEGLGGAGAIAGLWGTWHIIAGMILVVFFRWQERDLTYV